MDQERLRFYLCPWPGCCGTWSQLVDGEHSRRVSHRGAAATCSICWVWVPVWTHKGPVIFFTISATGYRSRTYLVWTMATKSTKNLKYFVLKMFWIAHNPLKPGICFWNVLVVSGQGVGDDRWFVRGLGPPFFFKNSKSLGKRDPCWIFYLWSC